MLGCGSAAPRGGLFAVWMDPLPTVAVDRGDLPEGDPAIMELVAQAAKLPALAQGCANSEDGQGGWNGIGVRTGGKGKACSEGIAIVVVKTY